MTIDENKKILRQIVNAQNAGDITIYNRLCTPNCLVHINMMDAMTMGQSGQFMGALQAAFPDGAYIIEDLVGEGDKIAVRYSWRGTHKGVFQGIPPTGKKVNLVILAIDRFSNGKLAEAWIMMDFAGLMGQLGVGPAPPKK